MQAQLTSRPRRRALITPQHTEAQHHDCRGLHKLRFPVRKIAQSQCEFDDRTDQRVRTKVFGEQIVHLKSVGKLRRIKKFDQGEDRQEHSHEILRPLPTRPVGTITEFLGRGRQCGGPRAQTKASSRPGCFFSSPTSCSFLLEPGRARRSRARLRAIFPQSQWGD